MPGIILGLDINGDSVTAVQIKGGLKGHQIVFCADAGIEESGGLSNALRAIAGQMEQESDACIASVPVENLSFRNLWMPFRDRKKIAQALPFEIEGMLPFPVSDLMSEFLVNDHSEKTQVLAASVKRDTVSHYLMEMQSCGIDPDILEIKCVPIVSRLIKSEVIQDYGLFLDIGETRITMALFDSRRISLIRTFTLNEAPWQEQIAGPSDNARRSFSDPEHIDSCFRSFCSLIGTTVHSFGYNSGRVVHPEKTLFTGKGALFPDTESLLEKHLNIPAQQIDLCRGSRIQMDENIARIWNPLLMDGALGLAMRNSKRDQGFNFRKDEFETKRPYLGFRTKFMKAAVLLSIVFSLLIADIGIDYYLLKDSVRKIDQKIVSVFRETFPDIKRIVDPLQQMKVRISETKKLAEAVPGTAYRSPVIEILREISKRVSMSLNVSVTRIGIDQETVRVSGKTDTYSTVDKIQNGLEGSEFFNEVTISSTNLDKSGNQVQFEIKLVRAR
ncbi:MAG: PilN domain-containing protein [Deltaproteobacteria bacterium]|nr:PilN domain-containing protein [Deltaproteobacteria bacterium]